MGVMVTGKDGADRLDAARRQGPRSALPEEWKRAGQLLLGAGLIVFGARRGGVLGALAVVCGIDRISPIALGGASLGQWLLAAARGPAEPYRRFGEGERDAVDEASWESFPASDPPGRGVG